ncbi:aldo/keto reductase [Candidatus Riflebacteria bacterium]
MGGLTEQVDAQYLEAIIMAIQNGLNVIDTALNYRLQKSERIISRALKEMSNSGIVREDLFISSKAGFIPGDADKKIHPRDHLIQLRQKKVFKDSEVVMDCHVMTPGYLDFSINTSLENLEIPCIDLYYLQNPETQLEMLEEDNFYLQLSRCFEFLEQMVEDKKITSYGLATWDGFYLQKGEKRALSLEKVLACAHDVYGVSNNFQALQLPFNYLTQEAYSLKNQPYSDENLSILQAAEHSGLKVFFSASLLKKEVFAHFTDKLDEFFPSLRTQAQKALQFSRSAPGLTSALVGMRDIHHVEDNLELFKHAKLGLEEFEELINN